jgi:hypothetical protein
MNKPCRKPDPKKLRTIPEATAYIGHKVCAGSLRLWIFQERLPCIRIGGKVFLHEDVLDQLIDGIYPLSKEAVGV